MSITRFAVPLFALALLAMPALAQQMNHDMKMDPVDNPADKQFLGAMHDMMVGMHQSMPTGDTDVDFVRMMLPHHQAAVDMAKTELQYGKDPDFEGAGHRYRRRAGQGNRDDEGLAGQAREMRLVRALPLLLTMLGLTGCGARDCMLDIAHRDCAASGAVLASFPQDDAICRSYGLVPGTYDYAVCRRAKARERHLTSRETDYGILQNPLTPDFTR